MTPDAARTAILAPMRLLNVVATLSAASGGPTTALLGQSRALAALGHNVAVLSVNAHRRGEPVVGQGRETRHEAGVRYEYFPPAPPLRWLRSPALAAALPAEVAAAELVAIHGLYLHPLLAAGRLCRRLGRRYVLRPLGTLDPVIQGRRRWRKRLANLAGGQALIDGAAALHFTSEAEAAIARPWLKGQASFVVPHGVSLPAPASAADLAAFRTRWLGADTGPVLLFLSRVTPKKGLDRLVAALPALRARWPRLKLLVAGYDEGLGAGLARQAQELGMGDALLFTGHLDGAERSAAFAAADLFVLPSQSENFGLAALEAAGSGVPTLLSPGVAVADELAQAGAAALAEPDPASLSRHIAALLEDAGARRALAERGRAVVPERYGWSAAACRLAAAYAKVLAA
jgi:glycosyltransferase involved in cell wall biosynthesis